MMELAMALECSTDEVRFFRTSEARQAFLDKAHESWDEIWIAYDWGHEGNPETITLKPERMKNEQHY